MTDGGDCSPRSSSGLFCWLSDAQPAPQTVGAKEWHFSLPLTLLEEHTARGKLYSDCLSYCYHYLLKDPEIGPRTAAHSPQSVSLSLARMVAIPAKQAASWADLDPGQA